MDPGQLILDNAPGPPSGDPRNLLQAAQSHLCFRLHLHRRPDSYRGEASPLDCARGGVRDAGDTRAKRGACAGSQVRRWISQVPPADVVLSYSARDGSYASAITSISTSTSLGSRATSTVDRAGGACVKYRPYTSFIAAKSAMFLRNTLDFTTFSSELPAAFRIAERFCSTRSVCAETSPS